VIDPTESGPLRSGVILGVGSISANEATTSDLDAAARRLKRWYGEMPDSETHSAAGWALRRWHRSIPALDKSINIDRDWQLNSVGMTMVKIPPGTGLHVIRERQPLNRSSTALPVFWLSDCELSRGTFQMFVDDRSVPDSVKPENWMGADIERSPSLEHPVQLVSWVDAVLFCNWLSRRESRKESYVWDGVDWQLVDGAKGYRLPTSAEWEYACRAGTTTQFVSGDDEQFLPGYAVYRSNQTGICGSKMPNPWGVFDVHGNVYEWGQDWCVEKVRRTLCSGAFDYSSTKCRSSNRESNASQYRSFTIGFRVARDVD